MIEFQHFKQYSDKTMLNWTKKELVEYIHCLLHNWECCAETKERVVNQNVKLQNRLNIFDRIE